MSESFHVVPWFDSEEWYKVYTLVFSSSPSVADKNEALKILMIWKARSPALPSGVESTLILLQVHLQEINDCNSFMNEQIYRLAYSSAVMRFVNHMLDLETAKGSSLYRAANNLGVPDWIVDLRHDTAHSSNLPSIELLREACTLSLDWLKINYWDKYKDVIKDYISGQIESNSEYSTRMGSLMNFFISVGIVLNSGSKIKNLADIPDSELMSSIIDDVRELFGNQIDLSNLKTISIKALEYQTMTQCRKMVMSKHANFHLKNVLLQEDSIFLSTELLRLFVSRKKISKTTLPHQYKKCFESLLLFLHSNDLLHDLLFGLIEQTQCCEERDKRLLASLWVSEILKALIKTKRFNEKIKQTNPDDMKSKNRKELLSLYHHWFPNEKKCIVLDLLKPIPQELTDITNIKPIISTYNTYLSHFISDLLELVEPPLPQATFKKICELTRLISQPNKHPITSSKIYTVDDLKSSLDIEIVLDENKDAIYEVMNVDEKPDSFSNKSAWQLASDDLSWSTCPIGILPWQM